MTIRTCNIISEAEGYPSLQPLRTGDLIMAHSAEPTGMPLERLLGTIGTIGTLETIGTNGMIGTLGTIGMIGTVERLEICPGK